MLPMGSVGIGMGARVAAAVAMSMTLSPIRGRRRDAAHGLEKIERGMRKWERGTVGPAVRSAFRVPRSDFETRRLLRDHVHRPVVFGELAAHPQQRLAADRRP